MFYTRFFIIVAVCGSLVLAFSCQNTNDEPTSSTDIATTIPDKVIAAMRGLAPQCLDASWDIENNTFIARCSEGDYEQEYHFNAQATCLQHFTYLSDEDLPETVVAYLQQHFPDDTPSIMAKVLDAQQQLTYQIELETALEYFTLTFDEKGALLQSKHQALSQDEIDDKVQ